MRNLSKNNKIIEYLKSINLCYQTTISEKSPIILEKSFYIGIDPSGSKIHVGHLVNFLLGLELYNLGMKIIIVIGNFTGQIGDPTFKNTARKAIDNITIKEYADNIKIVIKKILKNIQIKKYKILNNNDWLKNVKLSEYVEVLKVFNIKTLTQSQIFNKRNEDNPIYLHEMSYFTIQAYDFYYLWKKYNCELQIGGQDQWINMTAGITLIKTKGGNANVITVPLITDNSDNKISKTSTNSHIYFFDLQKTYIYNYINMYKFEEKVFTYFGKIFNTNNREKIIDSIFLTVYNKKLLSTVKKIYRYKYEAINKLNQKETENIDSYNEDNYTIKNIIKKFTHIEKSHHVNDVLKRGIFFNNKIINNIKDFYFYTKNDINYIQISEYWYIYKYNF